MINKGINFIITLVIIMLNITCITYAYTDQEVIDIVSKEGIMQGTGNGFEGEKNLTRAEMTVIAVKLKGIEDEAVGTMNFDDISDKHWANKFVGIASTYGIVSGTGDNKFLPDREVTLAETLTMLIRTIADYEKIDSEGKWPDNYIKYAKNEGLLKNINISGNSVINRIQTAKILANLISSPKWEGKTEKDTKKDFEDDDKDKIVTSVAGIGVILSVSSSEDGYTAVELVTPAGLKEYVVHGSELVAGTVLPGTFIDYWLSGTRMWDIIAEKVINLGENDNRAKIFNLGDGVIKLVKKGESTPVILDRNNIIFLKCDSMTLTEGVMEFEDLKVGFEKEVKLVGNSNVSTYDEFDGEEVFYHTREIDGEEVVVAIIYVD